MKEAKKENVGEAGGGGAGARGDSVLHADQISDRAFFVGGCLLLLMSKEVENEK